MSRNDEKCREMSSFVEPPCRGGPPKWFRNGRKRSKICFWLFLFFWLFFIRSLVSAYTNGESQKGGSTRCWVQCVPGVPSPARAAVDEHVVDETNDREKHIFNGIRVYRWRYIRPLYFEIFSWCTVYACIPSTVYASFIVHFVYKRTVYTHIL